MRLWQYFKIGHKNVDCEDVGWTELAEIKDHRGLLFTQ